MNPTRPRPPELSAAGCGTLSLAGTGLLSIGGLLGGELAYREHVGMIEDGAPSAPEALPPPGWASARVAIVAAPGVL